MNVKSDRTEARELQQLLHRLGACAEVRIWAKGKSFGEAWEQCKRADWMLWLCWQMVGKAGWPTRREFVLALERVFGKPRIAIRPAEPWTRKEADAAAYAAAYVAASAASGDKQKSFEMAALIRSVIHLPSPTLKLGANV